MPDTRPGSKFNKKGVCQACINYANRKNIDWEDRKKKLKNICEKYRRDDGYYDCVIPVSGGKDSHRLVYEMKVNMGMNPLLITVGDIFTKTEAGLNNYRNVGETFECDHILFDIAPELFRKVTRIAFEETGEPLKFVETAIRTVPFKLAIKLGIPLIIFGENSTYEYGTTDKQTYTANEIVFQTFKNIDIDYWLKKGFNKKELNSITLPNDKELKKIKPEVLYISYFFPWSSVTNLGIAKRYGFRDLSNEWVRDGYIENFEQIDSMGYLIHLWLKYPKFGFQRVSDIASRRVREGNLSLEEAKKLIKENDYKIDQKALDDFTSSLGYTTKEFWDIVERFWNREIFEKKDGLWKKRKEAWDIL